MRLRNESDYPSELHIGEETYAIQFVTRIPGGSAQDVGLADSGKKVIYLKKGMTKSMLMRTFVHEVIHALAEFEYEIKLKHKQVYQLERAIADFLLMNF